MFPSNIFALFFNFFLSFGSFCLQRWTHDIGHVIILRSRLTASLSAILDAEQSTLKMLASSSIICWWVYAYLQFKLLKNPVFAGRESKVILLEIIKLSYLFRSFLKSLNSRHKLALLTRSIGGWTALQSGDLDAFTFWTGCFSNTILATVFKMIPVTSAATERNWSIRGAIHTKVHNR